MDILLGQELSTHLPGRASLTTGPASASAGRWFARRYVRTAGLDNRCTRDRPPPLPP